MKTGSKLSEDEIQLYSAFVASKKAQPVAVDLAARVFQVCYIDKDTGRLYNRKLSRADFFKFITEQKDKVIWGFEACGACNFLARKVAEHGHDSKIMPAASIKSFLGIDKSDKIDAMGIFRALITPTIREIKPRSVGNQMLLWLFTAREQLNKQMVQTINIAHAILYEFGTVADKAYTKNVKVLKDGFAEMRDKYRQLPEYLHIELTLNAVEEQLDALSKKLEQIDDRLETIGKTDSVCRTLCSIPGIGPKTAVAFVAYAGDIGRFPSSRHFCSFIGVTPRITGTGGKIITAGFSKSGIKPLKRMLYMCAFSYFGNSVRRGVMSSWLKSRLNRKGYSKRKIIGAIMNRLCRIAYSVMKNGKTFEPGRCSMIA